jgi:hypothetical protein
MERQSECESRHKSEPKYFTGKYIPKIPNGRHDVWKSTHKCHFNCATERTHYAKWRSSYDSYIYEFYELFLKRTNLSKVNFDSFAEFVYSTSNGYISKYI